TKISGIWQADDWAHPGNAANVLGLWTRASHIGPAGDWRHSLGGAYHAAARAPAQPIRIQSRAARWAVAISLSDISAAISWRNRTASRLPFMAARLNHLCAMT